MTYDVIIVGSGAAGLSVAIVHHLLDLDGGDQRRAGQVLQRLVVTDRHRLDVEAVLAEQRGRADQHSLGRLAAGLCGAIMPETSAPQTSPP